MGDILLRSISPSDSFRSGRERGGDEKDNEQIILISYWFRVGNGCSIYISEPQVGVGGDVGAGGGTMVI